MSEQFQHNTPRREVPALPSPAPRRALPGAPGRSALPAAAGSRGPWSFDFAPYDESERLLAGLAALQGTSLAELYERLWRGARGTGGVGLPLAPGNEAARLGTRLEALEEEMGRSPHGKTTHLLRSRAWEEEFLDGPPRPDRAEWECLTESWIREVRDEAHGGSRGARPG